MAPSCPAIKTAIPPVSNVDVAVGSDSQAPRAVVPGIGHQTLSIIRETSRNRGQVVEVGVIVADHRVVSEENPVGSCVEGDLVGGGEQVLLGVVVPLEATEGVVVDSRHGTDNGACHMV